MTDAANLAQGSDGQGNDQKNQEHPDDEHQRTDIARSRDLHGA
jgi:hypothetical protein